MLRSRPGLVRRLAFGSIVLGVSDPQSHGLARLPEGTRPRGLARLPEGSEVGPGHLEAGFGFGINGECLV